MTRLRQIEALKAEYYGRIALSKHLARKLLSSIAIVLFALWLVPIIALIVMLSLAKPIDLMAPGVVMNSAVSVIEGSTAILGLYLTTKRRRHRWLWTIAFVGCFWGANYIVDTEIRSFINGCWPNYDNDDPILLGMFPVIGAGSTVIVMGAIRLLQLRRFFRSKHIIPVGVGQLPGIRMVIDQLTAEMQIEVPVVLYYSRSRSLYPSVQARHNQVELLVPSGLVSECYKDPEIAKAILAHELGHILQGDTRLWLASSAFIDVIFRGVNGILYYNLIIKIITTIAQCWTTFSQANAFGYRSGDDAMDGLATIFFTGLAGIVFQLIIIRIVRIQRESLSRALIESEMLADMAAVIYSDGSALARALEFDADTIVEEQYLSPSSRIRRIDDLLDPRRPKFGVPF